MQRRIFFGFTLAEIMVVLTVIGVLAGILVPIANNARPDKNVMKFKKADTTLRQVIRELVNSDNYYADGELGKRASNGEYIDGTHDGDSAYLCNTFADVVSAKIKDCKESTQGFGGHLGTSDYSPNTWVSIPGSKVTMDNQCKNLADGENIIGLVITSDGVSYYDPKPSYSFGIKKYEVGNTPQEATWADGLLFYLKENGFYWIQKTFCIDIDGIPAGGSANCDDKKDICPFGYGIRVDGKIMAGLRAEEWLEKDFQGKKEGEDDD